MAADYLKNDPFERDVEQAITALKKGTHLLKYGRRGKPKFCPFRLSNDETMLIWYSGRMEKQLNLIQVSRIIPGQRTAIFMRHPRPDKEYQSFSLIYGQRSLDLICKDKDEAESWFVALKALISRRYCKWTIGTKNGKASYKPTNHTHGDSPLASPCSSTEVENKASEGIQQCGTDYDARPFANFGNIFSDVILYTGQEKTRVSTGSVSTSSSTISGSADTSDEGVSGIDNNARVSYSSTVSSCSYGSGDDFDSMGDVLLWGKGVGDGKLAYSSHLCENLYGSRIDASLPKALESAVLLDIHSIGCGSKHSVLVTKQGEMYSWGEESGGRLGHGVDTYVTHPKLISTLTGINIESVACGEFHTCAVSFCGDLYTWGDGMHNFGLLGHGSDTAHWIPKKVCGPLEGLHVSSVSCGPWHTAVVTSAGQLFTFGDGVFGALGHGDRQSTNVAREVGSLRGMRTVRAACGAWHTVAIVDVADSLNSATSCKLFTWGDGNKGQLGHPDREARLLPACVESLFKVIFCQVACGYDFTVALSTSRKVYTMGSNAFGQLGNPTNDGKLHSIVKGGISSRSVEEIACGSHHVAALTSKAEVYTWGKGANGRLGHGNNFDRNTATLVEALKDKQVKSVVCGTDFTAVVCLHKCTSGLDQSICSGCHLQFGFRRKRHNCYNCGSLYCKACSTRKSMKASLAPNLHKTYRVCDECYTKLNTVGDVTSLQRSKLHDGNPHQLSSGATDRENSNKNLRVRLSRFLTMEPSKPEGKHSRSNSRFPLHHSGNLSLGSINFVGDSKEVISSCSPTSTTSPLSSRLSSPHFTNRLTSSGLVLPSPDSACTYMSNKNLTEEVARLQSQVNELRDKSKLLEAELDNTNNQLREARTTADVENLKCKAAKEVISSLTTQIKSITERAPEECTANETWTGQVSKSLGSHVGENQGNDVSRLPDSSVQLAHQLPCKGNSIVADMDWIEQVEPGVYITLFCSPAGHKYLRRVRFSKKHFSEQQAERWWAEHRPTLQQQYGILTGDSIIPSRTSQEKG
ncbi:PH, RCC1 and FYVE domains-containing protein 1-like [Lolium rigidum]|uniref:PH, RCC1 and FYVE domains-containing protein 1-like n=1 Tax=Lolium rigidum TaxID=89674 RepID=UPI001F5D5B89|nr:PH, RCC1 and FYVE domains-containing protein 1-like [Lolium rigidum]